MLQPQRGYPSHDPNGMQSGDRTLKCGRAVAELEVEEEDVFRQVMCVLCCRLAVEEDETA